MYSMYVQYVQYVQCNKLESLNILVGGSGCMHVANHLKTLHAQLTLHGLTQYCDLFFLIRVSEASIRPRMERRSMRLPKYNNDKGSDDEESQGSFNLQPTPSAPPVAASTSYYSGPFKALYDFESGNRIDLYVQRHQT